MRTPGRFSCHCPEESSRVWGGLRQKPSRSQALELPLASQMARWRPSGEGMAQPRSFSDSSRTGLALPRKSTFKSVGTPVGDEATTQRLRPSAAQSRHAIPVQDCKLRIRSFRLATEKSRMSASPGMRCFLAKARVEPSGESVQFCKYPSESSIRVSGSFSPVTGSKVKKQDDLRCIRCRHKAWRGNGRTGNY